MNHVPDEPDFLPRPDPLRRRKFQWSDENLAYWKYLDEQDEREREHVLLFARGVAFAMYTCSDPRFADEFLTVMVGAGFTGPFLLEIAKEARRLHAEWMKAGEITDEVVKRVVYGEAPDA